MSDLNRRLSFPAPSALVLAGLIAIAGSNGPTLAADEPQSRSAEAGQETYTWSAELVDFDEAARTVTVRGRVEYHAEIGDLPDFDEGDHVMLTWSGIRSAAGIRTVTRGTEAPFDRFMLTVEFVSVHGDGAYIDFRVPIPEDDVARIEAVPPGEWVTATSPHHSTRWEDAVIDIRGYNDVS